MRPEMRKEHTHDCAHSTKHSDYSTLIKSLSSDNQNRKVLEHLVKYGSITQREAIDLYNIYRLPSRIFELREKGVKIRTEHQANWYGKGTHGKYILEDKDD